MLLTTDVDNWPARRILFGLTQHFMCDRGRVAFTKSNVLHQVRERIPFAPAKVDVWQLACLIAQVKQERCNCVGDGRRHRPKYSIAVDLLTVDLQYAGKL